MNMAAIVRVFFLVLICNNVSAGDTSSTKPTDNAATERIVGGVVSPGYPWMTAVLSKRFANTNLAAICGGVLIAPRWVMSAAHCFAINEYAQIIRIDRASRYDVLVGERKLGEPTNTRIDIVNIHVHPDYPLRGSPDIALLELAEPVSAEPLRMALDSDTQDHPGNTAIVAGWGALSENGFSPKILREVDVPITTHAYCRRVIQSRKIIKTTMVCAGERAGLKDACFGDSGGPMFVTDPATNLNWLVGIVSFGEGCARPNRPGVYSRVAPFTMWARGVMGEDLLSVRSEGRLTAEFTVTCNKLRCLVDGGPSTEAANKITHYRWSFGDSEIEYGRRVHHTYRESGEYRITLQIEDARGNGRKISKRIRVVSNRARFHQVNRSWRQRLAATNASVVLPNQFGFYAQPGRVFGLLDSNATNFDLTLSYFNDAAGQWNEVARSAALDSNEVVRYNAVLPGRYRWQVRSTNGQGVFNLQSQFR